MTVQSTVISVAITLGGELTDFSDMARAALTTSFQSTLGCFKPDCLLELHMTSGSVNVEAVMTIPDDAGGDSVGKGSGLSTAAAVEAAAADLVSQPNTVVASMIASAAPASVPMTITVEGVAPVTSHSGVSVAIVVAPPPPSSPPISPPPPRLPPPPINPPPLQAGVSGGMAGVLITVAGAGTAVIMLAIVLGMYRARNRTRATALETTSSWSSSNAPSTSEEAKSRATLASTPQEANEAGFRRSHLSYAEPSIEKLGRGVRGGRRQSTNTTCTVKEKPGRAFQRGPSVCANSTSSTAPTQLINGVHEPPTIGTISV